MDIDKAIQEVMDLCDKYMVDYKMVSMRSALYDLHYPADQADLVIRNVASRGFSYCLDHIIPHEGGNFPDSDVCYWGPDQLKSRLESLR